jgi:hypothetical protein
MSQLATSYFYYIGLNMGYGRIHENLQVSTSPPTSELFGRHASPGLGGTRHIDARDKSHVGLLRVARS